MQCRRCGFENMPGLTACMKCKTVLTATAPVDVHPPRAGLMRHVRPLVYWFNRMRSGEAKKVAASPATDPRTLLWVLLSILPGLGHLASGRLKAIRLLWPAWFALFILGLLGAGAAWGSVFMGLAISMHAWIALDSADLRSLFDSALGRLGCVLIGFFMLSWLVYGGFGRHVLGGSVLPLAIDSHGLRPNDHILFWGMGSLQRGDLVRYTIQGTGPVQFGEYQIRGGQTVGRLLAFAGEKVLIGHGVLTVTPAGGQARQFLYSPLAAIFSFSQNQGDTRDFELLVPKGHLLCFPDHVQIVNNMLSSRLLLERLGVVPAEEVQGRAIMVYNTFRHVARIPRLPLEGVPPLNP